MYRVLIVDDKQPVLNAAKDWIERKYTVGGEEITVELFRLCVEVIDSESGYKISDGTLGLLNEYCNSSFNLILIDFGFVKKEIKTADEINRLHQDNPQKSIRELIDKIVLNPTHIVDDALKSTKYSKNIKKNFIDYCGNLYIYTYIPSQLERDYTCTDVRNNVTNLKFPKAKIKIIDTRKELFNDFQFEMKYDSEYYPFLISKFLSKIIQIEIAESLLRNNVDIKQKFEKIRKSNRLLAISIILPSIIAGIFIPSLFSSLGEKNYIIAISLFLGLIMITLTLTVGTRFLEKLQRKWFK
jgi:hypothetical protein